MSSRININATYAGDAHYRYHMSPLEIKASGRNAKQNISRTYLTNLADIAKELRRSPELILQCICVGTTSRCDRSSGIPSWYIKGGADQRQMQERIMQFCGHYVVCPKCGDCGTRLYAKAKSSKKAKGSEYRIRMSCGACGNDAATEAQDPQLGKCVAQHETPPKRSSGNPGKPNNPDKKPKAKPEDSDEEEWFTDLSEEAVQARRNALCPRAAQPFDSAIVTNSTQSTLSPAIEDQKESKVIKTSPDEDSEAAGENSECANTTTTTSLLSGFVKAIGEETKAKAIGIQIVEWARSLPTDVTSEQLFAMLEELPQHLTKQAGTVLQVLYDSNLLCEEEMLIWSHQACKGNENVVSAMQFIDFLVALT